MQIPIINLSPNPLPTYETAGAAGMDIRAHLNSPLHIAPFERVLVPTGLFIALPSGYEAQLRMRSSWALHKGLIMPNAPATIDADYRGEIKVMLANISNQIQTVAPGDRFAQMIIAKYESIAWLSVAELPASERGGGGFGSTGKE